MVGALKACTGCNVAVAQAGVLGVNIGYGTRLGDGGGEGRNGKER